MSSPTDQEAAEEILKEAYNSEVAGDIEHAMDLYQTSMYMWMEMMRNEVDVTRKAQLGEFVNSYMNRMEDLQKQIDIKKQHKQHVQSVFINDPSMKNYNPVPITDKNKNKSMSSNTSVGGKIQFNSNPTTTNTATSTSIGNRSQSNSPIPNRNKTPIANTTSKPKLSEYENSILNDMLDQSPGVTWDDIAGLSTAKQILQEAVVLPNLRPDLFTGLRSPPKGVLLFGPPGTGKTLLAKAVATESKFAFFSIKASSVASKWMGEGEKLMKALFEVGRKLQPTVIFFDEIDAILSARKENEHEASRRIKTEFMVQVDGAGGSGEGKVDRVLVMGATNIPWELDEAVLRRLVKRVYVPLPDETARKALIKHLLLKQIHSSNGTGEGEGTDRPNTAKNSSSISSISNSLSLASISIGMKKDEEVLTAKQLNNIVKLTQGYSGSDLTALCHEAAMGPIRELSTAQLKIIKQSDIRHMNEKDYLEALKIIRPSVSSQNLLQYTTWGSQFGTVK